MRTTTRPAFIPDHAQHVISLPHGLWLWEFSGGAIIYLGQDGMGQVRLEVESLEALITHIATHHDRYIAAIDGERARRRAYEDYLEGVDYEDDPDAAEG